MSAVKRVRKDTEDDLNNVVDDVQVKQKKKSRKTVEKDDKPKRPLNTAYLRETTAKYPQKLVMHVKDAWEYHNKDKSWDAFEAECAVNRDPVTQLEEQGKEGYRTHPLYLKAIEDYLDMEDCHKEEIARWTAANPALNTQRNEQKSIKAANKKAAFEKKALAFVNGPNGAPVAKYKDGFGLDMLKFKSELNRFVDDGFLSVMEKYETKK